MAATEGHKPVSAGVPAKKARHPPECAGAGSKAPRCLNAPEFQSAVITFPRQGMRPSRRCRTRERSASRVKPPTACADLEGAP